MKRDLVSPDHSDNPALPSARTRTNKRTERYVEITIADIPADIMASPDRTAMRSEEKNAMTNDDAINARNSAANISEARTKTEKPMNERTGRILSSANVARNVAVIGYFLNASSPNCMAGRP